MPVTAHANDGENTVERVSLLHLANILLKYRHSVLLLPLAFATLFMLLALILPAHYTARSTFIPQNSGSRISGLAGLGSQLGLTLPVGQSGQTSDFYVQLLRSRGVLTATARTAYQTPSSSGSAPDSATLVQLFHARGRNEAERLEDAANRLSSALRLDVHPTTGLVTLTVESRQAALSEQIVRRLLDLVNRFDLDSRRTRAAEKRRFIGERVAAVAEELRGDQDSLQQFLRQNRSIENSPALLFEQDRLRANVDLKRQVYTSLVQEYEQARIDEARDTPVITVVDPPNLPLRPDSRRVLFKGALGLLVGVVLAVAVAAIREFTGGVRTSASNEYQEFVRLKGLMYGEWNGITGRLRRRRGHG